MVPCCKWWPHLQNIRWTWPGMALTCGAWTTTRRTDPVQPEGRTTIGRSRHSWECQGLEFDGTYLWVASSSALNESIWSCRTMAPWCWSWLPWTRGSWPVLRWPVLMETLDYQRMIRLYQALTIRDDWKIHPQEWTPGQFGIHSPVKNFGPEGADCRCPPRHSINRDNQDILDISYSIPDRKWSPTAGGR